MANGHANLSIRVSVGGNTALWSTSEIHLRVVNEFLSTFIVKHECSMNHSLLVRCRLCAAIGCEVIKRGHFRVSSPSPING